MNIIEVIKNNRFSITNFVLIIFSISWSIMLFSFLNKKVEVNTQDIYNQKAELKIIKETSNEIILDYAKVKGNNIAIIEKLSDIEKDFTILNESNEKIMKIISALPVSNPKPAELPIVDSSPSTSPTSITKSDYLPPLPKKDKWKFLKPWRWF